MLMRNSSNAQIPVVTSAPLQPHFKRVDCGSSSLRLVSGFPSSSEKFWLDTVLKVRFRLGVSRF